MSRVCEIGSSPHTRGAPASGLRVWGRRGIIPAYAGSTDATYPFGLWYPDHPRIRGEHLIIGMARSSPSGSSPHTRGAPESNLWCGGMKRIIPAYAGSTWGCTWFGMVTTDHPRIRGEHAVDVGPDWRRRGSSPHTRGAPVRGDDPPQEWGIIPAYAGSTCRGGRARSNTRDHPRIRGEHASIANLAAVRRGSSPHTRGALDRRRVGCRRVRIIPAYAGSTPRRLRRPVPKQDHPRIRGEHTPISSSSPILFGSSPHTRGAPMNPS